jgi:outer membrane scaffolding protein for murein synthesis (MipA/OmpV family)
MKTGKTFIALLAVVFMFLMVADINHEVHAQDITAGLGIATAPDYEGSDDYDILPLPMLTVKWDDHRYIKWVGTKGQANLISSETWKGGVVLEFIGERDDVDDRPVDRMEDVDTSLMTGGFLGYHFNAWNVSVEAMMDIIDGNDGSIIRLNGGYKIPVDDVWHVSLGAFTTWANDDYMEAYFEVDALDSARSGLKIFNADSGFKDIGGSVTVSYIQWDPWGVMGLLRYARLVGDAKDSPVTDDRGSANQFVVGILGTYNF